MPRWRLLLAASTTLAMLAALSVQVVARQDDLREGRGSPTEFSGFRDCLLVPYRDGTVENVVLRPLDEGNLVLRERRGMAMRWPGLEITDPRLDGTAWAFVDVDEYVIPGVDIEVCPALVTGVFRIENDDGAWQGPIAGGRWPDAPEEGPGWDMNVLRGEGAYAGLTALWMERYSDDPCGWEVRGVVFDGEAPPSPQVDA